MRLVYQAFAYPKPQPRPQAPIVPHTLTRVHQAFGADAVLAGSLCSALVSAVAALLQVCSAAGPPSTQGLRLPPLSSAAASTTACLLIGKACV